MDKYSCLAYLLYKVENEDVKTAAIQLVQGDITLKEAKTNTKISPYLEACEKALKIQPPNAELVYAFIEEYVYAV